MTLIFISLFEYFYSYAFVCHVSLICMVRNGYNWIIHPPLFLTREMQWKKKMKTLPNFLLYSTICLESIFPMTKI